MNRTERRRLLQRIRADQPKKTAKEFRRSEKVEAACARAIGEIKDLTGETITRGLAVRLIRGFDTKIFGEWYRGAGSGEIFRGKEPVNSVKLLARFNLLRTASKGV